MNHLNIHFMFPKVTRFDFNIKRTELHSLSFQIHNLLRMEGPVFLTQVLYKSFSLFYISEYFLEVCCRNKLTTLLSEFVIASHYC